MFPLILTVLHMDCNWGGNIVKVFRVRDTISLDAHPDTYGP